MIRHATTYASASHFLASNGYMLSNNHSCYNQRTVTHIQGWVTDLQAIDHISIPDNIEASCNNGMHYHYTWSIVVTHAIIQIGSES